MQPSLANNALARFLSDGTGLLFGLIGGVITARWLGPGGKGAYASLTFLSILFSQLVSLGLGDATVILLGRKKTSLQEALSGLLPVLFVTSAVGAVALAIVANVTVGARGPTLGESVLVLSLTVPISAYVHALAFLINAQEKIVLTSIIRTIGQALTTAGLIAFVIVVPLNITGAVLAILGASSIELVLVAVALRRMNLSFRPRLNLRFLSSALRYGPLIQLAYVVVSLAARVDVLIVYWIAGRAEAGLYSVALTVGQLVVYIPFGLTFASYPRLAHIDAPEAMQLTAKVSRIGLAAALVSAVLLTFLIPLAIPVFFGYAYKGSVPPALVLVAGGLLWSELWVLCRAAVARGKTSLQLQAFGANLVVMVGLDVVLIPPFGIMGAAIASVVGPAVGLAICLRDYRHGQNLPILQLIPQREDFLDLISFVSAVSQRAMRFRRRV